MLPLLAAAMEASPAYVAVASGGDWILCYRRSPCNRPQDDWDLQAAQRRQGGPAPSSLLRCLWLSGSMMKGIRRFRASPAPSPGGSRTEAPAEYTAQLIPIGRLTERRLGWC